MFNAEILWPIFLANAERYRQRNTTFFSIPKGKPYRIVSVIRDVLHISRDGGGEDDKISFIKFRTCIRRLNENNINSVVRNAGIYENVAIETTIVELLPMLDWYNDEGEIIVLSAPVDQPVTNDGNKYQQGWYWANRRVRARKGQTKLRLKLFEVFEGSCCITNCSVKEVLDACHIHPFTESENCFVENALLLRSDLHDLFDAHLLGIDPVTWEINIHDSITDPMYRSLHGNLLRHSSDVELDAQALGIRWERFQEQLKPIFAKNKSGK